jgi:hypothetical protein
MYYGDLDPRLGGDKILSVQDYVAEMSAQTALGDPRRKFKTIRNVPHLGIICELMSWIPHSQDTTLPWLSRV